MIMNTYVYIIILNAFGISYVVYYAYGTNRNPSKKQGRVAVMRIQIKFWLKLLLIALIMAASMTCYEFLKQLIVPNITIWHSHIITIIFSTIAATSAAYFFLNKQRKLHTKLQEQHKDAIIIQRDLVDTVKELKEALENVKTLSGLLPICSSCKKIRDDKGNWKQMEDYIKVHTKAAFSHGLCPDCARELYPEFADSAE